jgi:hypothetical protein
MPADVAGRIDAALAAEALLDATLPHVPRETSAEPASTSGRAGDVPRGTSSAPSGHPGGSTGPGRKRRLGDQLSTWRRRGLLAVTGAVGTALLGGAIYAATSGSSSGSSPASLDSARQKGAAAGASDQVAGQVRDLLAGLSLAGRQQTSATEQGPTPMLKPNSTGSVMQPDGTHVDVPSCVLKATHRTQPPLAAERDSFQGRPSYLVVLPHPNDDKRVDAYVVNASCTSTSPGAVLFQGTYPR